ncbi:MAG TPA: BrnA antitoxin family protein [Longimicrobiaceae bacterium]|nr:BrnA antitoxin family protein [Longimicrobiaceae bacterium]
MSESRIIRRTLQDRRKGRTDWAAVDAMTEEELEARAAEDPDNAVWTEEELAVARLVLPADRAKVPVSIRLDSEVLEYFKAEGRGYQSRINAVLLGYVRAQRESGRRGKAAKG